MPHIWDTLPCTWFSKLPDSTENLCETAYENQFLNFQGQSLQNQGKYQKFGYKYIFVYKIHEIIPSHKCYFLAPQSFWLATQESG